MAEQLSMILPARTALGRDDFFVSPANAVALAQIERWPNWPGGKLVLAGPEGAGKTHLAHVWASLSGARVVAATDLVGIDPGALAQGPVAVEDIDRIGGNATAETALFHLHNMVLAAGHTLLLTGAGDPRFWDIALPDLKSRMMAAPVAALEYPDDALLAAVMHKLFADRQLMPGADTVAYLVKHIDRTFAAARTAVDRLDHMSLAEQKPITRAMARRMITQG